MMIEDDDSFVQQEGLDRPAEEPRRGHGLLPWLIVFITWLLWTLACVLIFHDRVAQAVEDSGVVPLIRSLEEEGPAPVPTRTVSLVYPFADGSVATVTMDVARYGSSALHDSVEALIGAYPYEALAQGALKLVDESTRLIGLTCEGGMCYVDLSREVLDSPSLAGYSALDQIRDSLLLDESVEAVTFLIEGEVLQEEQGPPEV